MLKKITALFTFCLFIQSVAQVNWQSVENQVCNAIIQIYAQKAEYNWIAPYKAPLYFETVGTGFFINDEGDFLTNYHTVKEAKSVTFSMPALGQEILEAKFVGACPEVDIALFKLTTESKNYIFDKLHSISYLNLGDSDKLYKTQPVLAVGFPYGFKSAKYTLGNVAGFDYFAGSSFIHITSPLNVGNLGGPCLNKQGEVIGINVNFIKEAQNMGYMIPINNVKKIINYLYKEKYYIKTNLGIYVNASNDEQAESLNNPTPAGVYITYVEKNSIADKAGIKKGDMLYEIKTRKFDYNVNSDGKIEAHWGVSDKVSVIEFLSGHKLGKTITLVIWQNGERKEIDCTFDYRAKQPIRMIYPELESEELDYEMFAGACFMQLRANHFKYLTKTNSLRKFKSYKNEDKEIVIVTNILPGSQIDLLDKFYPGLVIDKVNNVKIKNLKDLRQAISDSSKTKKIKIDGKGDISAVLSLDKVLSDERRLADNFMFPISDTVRCLRKIVG